MRLFLLCLKVSYLLGFSILVWISTTLKGRVMDSREKDTDSLTMHDRTLLRLTFDLAAIGFIMVTSALMPMKQRLANDSFFFAKRDGVYLVLAFILTTIMLRLPMEFWQRYSTTMLLGFVILLIIVLIVGSSVKGASRWIDLDLLRIQPAELTKLLLFCYTAGYPMRKGGEIRNSLHGFLKPMSVTLALAVLLLTQPGLGTAVALFATTLAILFLAGAKSWRLIATTGMGIPVIALLIFVEPYRICRATVFWNPWEGSSGSGYQLTQLLTAFNRGELWGQGLGNSVQKLECPSEAHTNFIFAIIDEKLGYAGMALASLMVFFIASCVILIGRRALEIDHRLSDFLVYSVGIWSSLQALVSVGAAVEMSPIKGLTLSPISCGGSSLLVMSTAIMMLLRTDHETRLERAQVSARSPR